MASHLSEHQIRRYRHRLLSGAELLAASSHIAQCEGCRAGVASPEELQARVRAFRTALESDTDHAHHLTYEDIVAHVDGQLEDADRVRDHIRACKACAADLREIEALKRELRADEAPPPLGRRLRDIWRSLLPPGPRILVPAVAICGIALIVLTRGPSVQRPTQNARSEPVATPPSTTPPPSAAPATVIRDGERVVSVDANGVLTGLEGLPAPYRAALTRTVIARRIDPPRAVADLAGRPGVLLGAPGASSSITLLRPIGTVVESDRPAFSWTPGAGGAEYQVSVYDDRYSEIATSGWIRGTAWSPGRPLRRGARYAWQITVRQDGHEWTVPVPPSPEARFVVLGADERAELAAVRTASGNSHLALGVLYARAGLLDQAEEELSALGAANPGSQTVAALLASVKEMR